MTQNQSLVGSIDLSALNGVQINTTVNGKRSIVIPVDTNPAIFIGAMDKGGHIYMDIEVRESPEAKYGNTHFIKLGLSKKKREEMGLSDEQARQYTPIIGNLRPRGQRQDASEDLPE